MKAIQEQINTLLKRQQEQQFFLKDLEDELKDFFPKCQIMIDRYIEQENETFSINFKL